jgi:hypothetical protein
MEIPAGRGHMVKGGGQLEMCGTIPGAAASTLLISQFSTPVIFARHHRALESGHPPTHKPERTSESAHAGFDEDEVIGEDLLMMSFWFAARKRGSNPPVGAEMRPQESPRNQISTENRGNDAVQSSMRRSDIWSCISSNPRQLSETLISPSIFTEYHHDGSSAQSLADANRCRQINPGWNSTLKSKPSLKLLSAEATYIHSMSFIKI